MDIHSLILSLGKHKSLIKLLFIAIAFTLLFYSMWGSYFWVDLFDYEQHIVGHSIFWSDPIKNVGNFLYPMWIYFFYPNIQIFMTVYLCLVIPVLLFYYVKKSIGKNYPVWICAFYFWSGFPFYFLRTGFMKTTIFVIVMLIGLIIYHSLSKRNQWVMLGISVPITFSIQYPQTLYNSMLFHMNTVYVNINNAGLKGLFLFPFVAPFIKDKRILCIAALMYVVAMFSNRVFGIIYILIFPYIFIPLGISYKTIKEKIPKPILNVVIRTTTFIKEKGFIKNHGSYRRG